MAIGEVAEQDIADFSGSLRNDLGPSSAARTVVAVRNLHRFALAEGMSSVDPARHVRPPAIPRRLPKALAYEDLARLLGAAGNEETAVGLRDRALVELLYATGTRISEAVGLDVDDIDTQARSVLLRGKGGPEGSYSFACTGDAEAFREVGERFLQLPLGRVAETILDEGDLT